MIASVRERLKQRKLQGSPILTIDPVSPPVEPPAPLPLVSCVQAQAPSEPEGVLHHVWSQVLGCEVWVMATDAQAQAQRDAGQAACSVREVRLLQGLQAAHPDAFAAVLHQLHDVQSSFAAMILDPEPPEEALQAAARPALRHPRSKPRDPALGPILAPCATCGELRHWHDHVQDVYQCWTCVPPVLRTSPDPASPPLKPSPGNGCEAVTNKEAFDDRWTITRSVGVPPG